MSALDDGSPFGEAWRACLVEHYKAMAQDYPIGSRVMEQLDMVMAQVGFHEDDLRALLIEATMRADDVSDAVAAQAAHEAAHTHHEHPAHDAVQGDDVHDDSAAASPAQELQQLSLF